MSKQTGLHAKGAPSPKGPPQVVDGADGNLRTLRILVALEAPDIFRLVKRTLQQSGYQVTTAVDGREVLEKVKSEKPDLLVLDTVLPSMNGFAVMECMESDAGTAGVPILFFQTKRPAEDAVVFRYFSSGADFFLTVP